MEAFLRTIPNLELVENKPMSILAWFSTIKEIKSPAGFRLSKLKSPEELLRLLDKPTILQAVKDKLVPFIKQKTREMKAAYQMFQILNEAGEFIAKLEVADQPSQRIKECFDNELKPRLDRLSEEEL